MRMFLTLRLDVRHGGSPETSLSQFQLQFGRSATVWPHLRRPNRPKWTTQEASKRRELAQCGLSDGEIAAEGLCNLAVCRDSLLRNVRAARVMKQNYNFRKSRGTRVRAFSGGALLSVHALPRKSAA